MTTEMILASLTDPFRIVLMAGLVITMARTEAVTGRVLPLGLGVLFVAVLIPMTTARDAAPFWPAVAAGVIANLVMLALALVILAIVRRLGR